MVIVDNKPFRKNTQKPIVLDTVEQLEMLLPEECRGCNKTHITCFECKAGKK
jgi:hypothetical protein